jgi:multicomponent Na+:H+ antiporter subunit E
MRSRPGDSAGEGFDSSVRHAVSLSVLLFGVWLLLSGHYVPLLLTFGVVSCLLVVAISMRMDVIDHEGHPIHLSFRALVFWPWLIWQIILSNIDVARRILFKKHGISPNIILVPANQKSDLGKVIYANSITLTPGTISLELEDNQVLVHALTHEGADDLAAGEMHDRVTKMEGKW